MQAERHEPRRQRDAGSGREPRRALRPAPVRRREPARRRAQRERLPRRHPRRLAGRGRGRLPPPPGGHRSGDRCAAGQGLLRQRVELPDHRAGHSVRDLGRDVHGVRHQPRRGRLAARQLLVVREPVQPGHRLRPRLQPGVRRDGDRPASGADGQRRRRVAVRDRHEPQRPGPARHGGLWRRALQPARRRDRRAQRRQLVQSTRVPASGCARRRRRTCRWSTRTCG